jgi:hypothetical protein
MITLKIISTKYFSLFQPIYTDINYVLLVLLLLIEDLDVEGRTYELNSQQQNGESLCDLVVRVPS